MQASDHYPVVWGNLPAMTDGPSGTTTMTLLSTTMTLLSTPRLASRSARCIALPTALAGMAIVSYALIILTLPAGSTLLAALDDVGMVALLAVTAGLAFAAAYRQPAGWARWSWGLIGLGLACWTLGDAYWAWAELILDEQLNV